jgi:peptide-methionine (S)-S-oxide reductase
MDSSEQKSATAIAVFAGGCFWCTEAVFRRLKGVRSVLSGYTGGSVPYPSWEQVCETDTQHAEAIRIEYDPAIISYEDLLTVFFGTHDPTALNRQGPDIGSQYRSAIFYADEGQRRAAAAMIGELDKAKAYDKPVVTEVAALGEFYPAEEFHRDYYRRNIGNRYCEIVIAPKLEKLEKRFAELLAGADV